MQLGYGIRREEPQRIAARARELEAAGIDVFWVAELYGMDGVSMMGFLAAVTERARIGSSILPFYSRTPALLAMSAAGVDQLSGGRAILGIGSSGPQVIEGFHGVPFDAPVGRTGEIIDICRQVWRRDEVVHDGRYYQVPLPADRGTGLGKALKMIDHPVRDRIPIFVAALGPRNVELVAREAEGWIPIFFWPERAEAVWGEHLAAGRARRDGSLGPLDVAVSVSVGIGDGLEGLREEARPQLAFYLGGMGARDRNFYNDLAVRYGFATEAREVQDRFLAGDRDGAARAVPAALVEGISAIGPAGYVRERLAAYQEAGVTILNVRPVGPEPMRTIETLRGWLD
ncbi:MAG: LLM class F420-dependent oxidoreductase [Acidimicrobiales bacterium]|jgi:F420-dependent oxidoreductase-like protein